VEELVRRRILHGAGERFDFSHDRIREAVYRQLLPPRRKALHRRIGEALEALYASDLESHALALGVHYREGEVWPKAAAFFRRAGAAATARSAHREAVACFEQALLAIGRLPDDRSAREQAVDLRFDIRNSYFPIGEDERTLDHLREAEALAIALDDRHRLGWALTYISNTYWRMADQRRALQAGERALELATTLGDARLAAMTNFRLGQVHNAMGDYGRAVAVLRQSVTTLDGELARQAFGLAGYPAVHSRAFLAVALAELGDFTEAIVRAEEALKIARAVNQPFSIAIGSLKAGIVHLLRGDLPRALDVLDRGRDVCRTAGMPTVGIQIETALGAALALGEKVDEARTLLEPAVQRTAAMFRPAHALATTWLSETHAVAGRLDAALQAGGQALELARQRGERGTEAHALRVLGDIAARRRPPAVDVCRQHLSRAHALASELGARPLVARCELALGELWRRAGQTERAAPHLDAAVTMFRELDMPFWVEKAGTTRRRASSEP
jgi:tetratricopeptide (TPR) repeat protein